MKRYRKWFVIIGVFFIAAVSIAMIYHINYIFPNPENKVIHIGETDLYKGLTLKAGEIEIYTWEELLQAYPNWQDDSSIKEDVEVQSASNYIIINFELTNYTETKFRIGGKEGIMNWIAEAGTHSNGVEFMSFLWLNKEYHRDYEAGETQSIKLPFAIRKEYLSIEELKNMDIKLVYSYYPTKNYILYENEKKE